MTEEIRQISEQKRSFGEAICRRIIDSLEKFGFANADKLKAPVYDEARFCLVTDPFTQSQDLVGYWYDDRQQRIGQIRFHGDGSFYAEFDVFKPHPVKANFYIEAINAWGNQDNIKIEPKLLPMPG